MHLTLLQKQKHSMQSAKYAAVFSLACWLLLGLFLENALLAGLLGLLCFFPVFFLALYNPIAKKKRHGKLVESCLPFSLLKIAVELGLGVPFVNALEHASEGKDCCAKEFRIIAKEIKEQGASVEQALRHFAERTDSSLARRAVTQLAAASEQGSKNSGKPIKRIAIEMLTRQKLESKLFSGKMVLGSLLFIAVSAIVPALFQSFSIVGSVILQLQFTAIQLFLIIVVGFPLLDLAVLLFIRSRTPVFLRGQ